MTVAYQEKFITLNGVRLRYLDWGAEGNTPLICMHGHAGQAHIWDEFAEAMSPHFHVYTLDQRGHGGSGWAVDGYARDRFVLDLAAFTEALGIQKCVLAGLSMGGWNALLYADAYPDNVDRAIIVDIGPERSQEALRVQVTRPPTPMRFYNFEEAFQWHREGNPWAEETRLRKDVANKMVQKSTGMWEWKADPALLNNTLADNQDPAYIDNYWRIHRNLPCPVLEVRGKESILLSDDIIERMKQASENFSSVDVEDAGHVVTVDKPQEFIEACLAFLGLAAEEEEAPPELSPTDLTTDDVRAMGKAVGLDISDADLAEVAHVLNAIIESIDVINPPGIESVEPLPILLPAKEG